VVEKLSITSKQIGFTLIELMVAIVVLVIVLALGISSFREQIMNNQITTSANEFATALSMARIEAVKRGSGTVITANAGGGTSNEWGVGFVVAIWVDTNDDEVVDAAEIGATLRQIQPFSDEVTFDASANVTEISFLNTGAYNSASSTTFALCDSRTGETGRQFTLNVTGTFNLDREYSCP
jgi:type IV fimbrial biogenesis protein FimT